MKKSQSRNLVIDASIARAAGGSEAIHPASAITRDFLQEVLTICHKTVMTHAIQAEWDQHQSGFARKWRSSMVARKKLIALDIVERSDIRQSVESENVSRQQKDAMLKDCHLIEAAISADTRIISLDDKARELFVGLSLSVAAIKDIQWVNPVSDKVGAMTWLESGQDDVKWKLAHD